MFFLGIPTLHCTVGAKFDEPQKLSHREGVKIFEASIKYVEQQEKASTVDIMMLQSCRDMAT